ncbi:MAG: hypothetical protein CVU41_14315 [Chloroflexi bacterium HGW-Chloroflexi-3]|nr:MAG: hypothetical protein CVU41_14315 [Chloroflexi bacterium HGW-Chloroflexi-3]
MPKLKPNTYKAPLPGLRYPQHRSAQPEGALLLGKALKVCMMSFNVRMQSKPGTKRLLSCSAKWRTPRYTKCGAEMVLRKGCQIRKGKAFDYRETQKIHTTPSYSNHYNKSTNLGSNALPIRLGSQPGSLPAVVQNFKSVSSRKINKLLKTPGSTIWHRNYYEHIIRDKVDFERIVADIEQNPQKWEEAGVY